MAGTVGIIGLGIMGGAISKNLVERGWRVLTPKCQYQAHELGIGLVLKT